MDSLRKRPIAIGLLRHAKAVHGGGDDFRRPLAEKGWREIAVLAGQAPATGFLPELILASAAVRARETAERFKAATGAAAEIVTVESLYLAAPETIWRELASAILAGFSSILLVGHNPGISGMAAILGGNRRDISMRTAELIVFRTECDGEESPSPVRNWRIS